MPDLSIKNVPPDVLSRLRTQAQRNRRSLQGELLHLLETTGRPAPLSVAEARRRLAKLRLSTPDDAASTVRAERDVR